MNRSFMNHQGWWRGATAGLAMLLCACSPRHGDAGRDWLKSAAQTPEDAQAMAQTYGIDASPSAAAIPPKDVNVPTDVATQGKFGAVFQWPVIPLHVSLLPDGRVLGYGAQASGSGGTMQYAVWTPSLGTGSNAITTLSNSTGTDIFCTGFTVQPQTGDVLMVGGTRSINGQPNYGIAAFNIFRTATSSLQRQSNDMAFRRWYPTIVTTWDGQQVILGGRDYVDFAGDGTNPPTTATYATTPELYTQGQGFKTLTGANSTAAFGQTSANWNYPRAWQAPNGKIYIATFNGKSFWMDWNGAGSVTAITGISDMPSTQAALPSVMYRPGQMLTLTNGAKTTLIDINPATPTWRATDSPSQLRLWANATVQADGKVFVNGGSQVYNELSGESYRSETWDPDTGHWTPGAVATRARLYHSVALLLPDATILTGAGGAPGPQNNPNGEIYSPPYLFKKDGSGQLASRPSITSGPSTALGWGQAFDLGISSGTAVSRVTLIRAASVTHAFSSDERFIEMPYAQSGTTVHLTTPADPEVAPPGYYMVFVFDANGVPSVARILRIMDTGGAPPPPPPPPPPVGTTIVYDGASASSYTPILGSPSACDKCALNVNAPVISGNDGSSSAQLKFKPVNYATGVYFKGAVSGLPVRSFDRISLSVLPTAANLSMRVELGLHDNYNPIGPVKSIIVAAPSVNAWNHLSIPMTSYPDAQFNYVAIKSADANGSSTFYVDNVVLEKDGGTALPAAPASLSASPGDQQVTLNWTSVSGATGYNVYMGTFSGGEGTTPTMTGVTGTSTTVTGLANGTTVYFIVKAVNAAGTGPASPEASATPVAPVQPPAAPQGLAATAGDASVSLQWNAVSGAATYQVYQGTAAGGEGATPVVAGITGTTATVDNLVNGTSYYFVVRAVNTSGTSGASNEVSATPAASPAGVTVVYDGTSPGFQIVMGNSNTDCNACATGVNAPVISDGNGQATIRLQFKTVNYATGVFMRAPAPEGTRTYTDVRLAVYPTAANLSFRLEVGSRDTKYVQTGPVSSVIVSNLTANQWNSVVVPMTSYADAAFNYVAIKSANANGSATFYVDNFVLER